MDALAAATRRAAEEWNWNPSAVAPAVDELKGQEDGLYTLRNPALGRIEIPQNLAQSLQLETWSAASPSQNQASARSLEKSLKESGILFTQLATFGPLDDPFPIAQFHQQSLGLTWNLIPGGPFRPGYSPDELVTYKKVYNHLFAHVLSDPESAAEYRCNPAAATIYGSDAPCDLRQKSEVLIPPMLVAHQPLLIDSPVIRKFLPKLGLSLRNQDPHAARNIPWNALSEIVTEFNWAILSSQEWEWIIRGGRRGLFYWGDIPHPAIEAHHGDLVPEPTNDVQVESLLLHSTFEPDWPRNWPWVNRFGMEALLSDPLWCTPNDAPDGAVLVTRGGAASCFPWQYCGEWQLLLSAVESRKTIAALVPPSAALRPALRLFSKHS